MGEAYSAPPPRPTQVRRGRHSLLSQSRAQASWHLLGATHSSLPPKRTGHQSGCDLDFSYLGITWEVPTLGLHLRPIKSDLRAVSHVSAFSKESWDGHPTLTATEHPRVFGDLSVPGSANIIHTDISSLTLHAILPQLVPSP